MSEGAAVTAACRPMGPRGVGTTGKGRGALWEEAAGRWRLARQGLPAQVRMGVRRK